MIVEAFNLKKEDCNSKHLKKGQFYLVLEIFNDLSSQEIFYQILTPVEQGRWIDYNNSLSVDWENFKIADSKMPLSWMFECLKDSYSFRSVITPAKWSSKYWTYGFGEALNCYNDTGYDKISFQEHERAKDVFLEEAKKIYEECGRGWVSNPFQRLRNN